MEYALLIAMNIGFYSLVRKLLRHRWLATLIAPAAASVAFELFVRFVVRETDALWVVSLIVTWLLGTLLCMLLVFVESVYRRLKTPRA